MGNVLSRICANDFTRSSQTLSQKQENISTINVARLPPFLQDQTVRVGVR